MIRGEKGQSAVEFALLLPVFLLLVCGIVDIGRLGFLYLNLHMGAQETVRLGGLGRGDTEIAAFAHRYVKPERPADLTVTVSPAESSRSSGQYATVQLTRRCAYLTPVVSALLPAPVIRAESTIRVE